MKSLLAGVSCAAMLLPVTPALADDLPVAEPLPAPTLVTAVQSGSSVEVTWAPTPGATTYTATATPGSQTCTSPTTSCIFRALPPRTTYTFTVTAADATRTSAPSAPSEPLFVRARLVEPIFEAEKVRVGRSVKGRTIWAERQGNPLAVNVLLSVGQMHGSEPAGLGVTKRLRAKEISSEADYQLWTIRTMNPDGAARRNRYNVRGVDLNRNFPGTWARQYRTGRGPGSEPETRAMMRFIRKLQPTGVLSFHQPWDTTLSVCDTRSAYWVRLAARLMKLNAPGRPSNCGNWLPGTMNRWTARNTPAWFVTVELPPNYKVRRYLPRAAAAVVTIAEQIASEDSGFFSP